MTVAPTPILPPPPDQRFVLDGVDWEFYDLLLNRLGDRHVFLTYDRGRLELMSPSFKHDDLARLLGLLIHILADEMDLSLKGCGSTTFRRRDLDRGLEPDECFYVANAPRIRGKDEIDLAIDPPPDLAVEVEISHRLLDRVEIYAALGVPELWRHDGSQLHVFRLDPAGQYQQYDHSPTFPGIPLAAIDELLQQARNLDEVKWARAARAWIRQNVARP